MADAFNDGSEVLVVTPPEDCPDDFVDAEEFLADPTDNELAMGQLLGEMIDVDDDEDNGAAVVNAIAELI
jgi:hypothetical protein